MQSLIFFSNQTPAQPPAMMNIGMILIMFAIMYFIVFRPQQKRQKEHQNLLKALEKNAEVVTAGGVHGTVVQVKENTVVLRVADNTKIEFDKQSISRTKKG